MKRKIGAILLVVALVLALALPMASVGANVPGPDLVGLWHFDGDANDSSGNGNNGTINGGASFVSGMFGQALSFDGVDAWVDIIDLSITGDFSIEFWVNLDPGIGNQDAVVGQEGSGQDINFYAGKCRWYTASESGSPHDAITASTSAVQSNWEYYAITRSGDTLTLYRNGVVDATAVITAISNLAFHPEAIGRGNAGYFDGLIDEVRIWDEALSAEQIGLDLFDVTVNAEGSALEVPIDWVYGSPYVPGVKGVTSDTDTTEFTLESILENTEVTLTAPDTHTEDYTFYVFDHWDVDESLTYDEEVTFTVDEALTATAHYTKVMSVDKTLEECYLGRLVETVTVPADSSSGASSTAILEDGKTYILKASGTFNAAAGITADAEYSSGPSSYVWQEPVEKYESYGVNLLDLKVNNEFVDWGAYNPSHVYWKSEEGTGDPVAFTFSIYDLEPYSNNSGSLAVEIWEGGSGEACDPDAVPLQTVVSFGMTITVHAWDALTPDTDIYVEDGIGADLVVDDPAIPGNGDVNVWKAGKGKMGATKIGWTIEDPEPCTDYTLDIDVHTGLNPKDKQEYTSTGDHELNSGPIVYFTYDGTMYILQGPEVMVTVVGDED